MSHIYEALQRAEAERRLGRHSDAPEADIGDPSPGDQTAPRSSKTRIEERLSGSPTLVVDRSSISPNDILRRPWALSLDQLPALQKKGAAVEQFRRLRSHVQELRDLNRLKTILVSSGLPQEGKSFVAANLAASLARHKNSKVLLIDGDMRRPTLHQVLGCKVHPGLADYLAGTASILEVMQCSEQISDADAPVSPLMNNCVFIPGGKGGDKAADLSGNSRFGVLLATVAPHFDWIIVDSSPVIPVSDAVSLARSCDGVLLVARAGVTTFSVAQRAQDAMKTSNIIGVVLNGVTNHPVMSNYYNYENTAE